MSTIRFKRVRIGAFCALLALTIASIPAGAGGAVTAFPSTAAGMRDWAPTFMTWPLDMNRDKALQAAAEFDVISATKATFRPFVEEMKAVNPDLVLLVYMNGTLVPNEESSKYEHDESLFAHEIDGDRIYSGQFGNVLMNVAHPDWISAKADECVEFLAHSGYDGCLLDAMGPAAVFPGYMTGVPVNPATGEVWTKYDYVGATAHIVQQVKARVAPALVVPNGITWGRDYLPTSPTATHRLVDVGDGGFVELFIREPKQGLATNRKEPDWKKDVDMLVDAEAKGKALLTTTKAWTTGTIKEKDAAHKYALASFLLGTSGKSYFSFLYDKDTLYHHKWWNKWLGPPLAPYAKIDGVYQRPFKRGLVVVNPTTAPVTASLGGLYKTFNGVLKSSVTLNPYRAEIFIRV